MLLLQMINLASVAIDGDTIVIGANFDDRENGENSGSA